MGPLILTGLDTVTLALQVLLWVAGALVVGLSLGVAVPALTRASTHTTPDTQRTDARSDDRGRAAARRDLAGAH
ncbi:hypothetical protein [Phycicoccus flavus]|uniref:Uncharacterized protein n=1 Tax=Phycicoccus flavus TaxID=2502783 RepID=A0A8T6R295_9MICO|nr:hypothetical protein [Phycicoccus flavus]NHA67600.1 hypothetical protein [Phycicoccus flavus]